MSHHEHNEILAQELIAFDPDLKEHEVALRTILSELTKQKPDIVIDEAFAQSLRARILLSAHKTPEPPRGFDWWAMKIAPIGALALLTLILVPQNFFKNTITHDPVQLIEDIKTDPRVLDVEMGETSAPHPAPTMEGGSIVSSDMSMKSAFSLEVPNVPLFIFTQEPGIRFSLDSFTSETSGFLVVTRSIGEADGAHVMGVSPYIPSGNTKNIMIHLNAQTNAGETYQGKLYEDNGDKIFTEGEDEPYIDTLGNPVEVIFEVISP